MRYTFKMPKEITNNSYGYEFITSLYHAFIDIEDSDIFLTCDNTNIIAPNFMAHLGLILNRIKDKNNKIFFRNLNYSIKKLLANYGFICCSSFTSNDFNDNCIKYNSFSSEEFHLFKQYFNKQVNEIKNFAIINELRNHFSEIFVNVKMHARKNDINCFNDKEIYTCGYYDIQKNFVCFTFANNGLTFKENIINNKQLNYNKEFDYILWALKQGNSTRTDTKGGIGLFMFKDLIEESNGEFFIISGKGYVNHKFNENKTKFRTICKDLDASFPGTIITAIIPLDNLKHLKDDIILNNIFSMNDLMKGDF